MPKAMIATTRVEKDRVSCAPQYCNLLANHPDDRPDDLWIKKTDQWGVWEMGGDVFQVLKWRASGILIIFPALILILAKAKWGG